MLFSYSWPRRGWGAPPFECGTGMCHCHDPSFHGSQCFLSYQYSINAALMYPIFNFYRNFTFPELLLAKISEFSLLRPLIFEGNPLLRLYFQKPVRHIATKKTKNKNECPLPHHVHNYLIMNGNSTLLCIHKKQAIARLPFTRLFTWSFMQLLASKGIDFWS